MVLQKLIDLLVIGYVQNKKLQITGATQFEF